MRLDGKTAIITGGAHGIGEACAARFAQEGASVVIADIDEEAGAAVAQRLGDTGYRALFIACDVGDTHQAGALVDGTLEWAGRLDVLVNNAGIIKSADFLELTEEDFDRVLRVNLKGAFLVAQAAARAMTARGGGAIINMSSVNSVMAIPNQLPYNASKGGMNQLTRNMALALADKGVRVNGIGPGSIATELLQTVMADEAARRKILSRTPMLRCGEPDEVARVAVFLASDDASYMTGQTLYVDGGRMALNYTVPVPE